MNFWTKAKKEPLIDKAIDTWNIVRPNIGNIGRGAICGTLSSVAVVGGTLGSLASKVVFEHTLFSVNGSNLAEKAVIAAPAMLGLFTAGVILTGGFKSRNTDAHNSRGAFTAAAAGAIALSTLQMASVYNDHVDIHTNTCENDTITFEDGSHMSPSVCLDAVTSKISFTP